MKTEIKLDVDGTLKKIKEFIPELKQLCAKYNVELGTAKDDETNDNFIVINIKDFIKEEDIKMNIVEK